MPPTSTRTRAWDPSLGSACPRARGQRRARIPLGLDSQPHSRRQPPLWSEIAGRSCLPQVHALSPSAPRLCPLGAQSQHHLPVGPALGASRAHVCYFRVSRMSSFVKASLPRAQRSRGAVSHQRCSRPAPPLAPPVHGTRTQDGRAHDGCPCTSLRAGDSR
ncbi:uncharacterized protein [Muntiacus reevesi]|uniref:uncharacterized protein isoform X2 n=1 Tax=Muntiacus reevesi TaxID=9886 RepID=UPI0033079F25